MEMFFLTCAIIGGVLFLIRLVMLIAGFDHADGDIGSIHEVDTGASEASFKLLSLQGLTAFFVMFGLVGYAMLHSSKLPPVYRFTSQPASWPGK